MRFAIVESGGKQYRAVEGSTIEVDRLPVEPGKKFDIAGILLVADDENIMVGTPTVSDMLVKATVVDHFKGPKVVRFKYRPKKRIRVKGGHRHQYTRLMIDFIGKPGEERKVEKPVKQEAPVAEAETEPKAEKQPKGPKKEAKPSTKKTEKAPAKASPKGKKSTTSKTSSKKTEKK